MRREFAFLLLILLVAFAVRVSAPWQAVFGGGYVNFLETDAWYHIRLIEHQVRNWPWRPTLDPYAAAGGQFIPIAPFFDTMTATAVLVAHGRDASVQEIERLAAFMPPVLGTLAIAALFGLARTAFDARAAVIAAALLAIVPGHFLDRTALGFYDHHALEALLAIATLWAVAAAVHASASLRVAAFAGISLGLYLLGWSSGAFLLAILGVWLVVLVPLARGQPELAHAGRVTLIAATVALVLVLAFQDPRMFRYESQVFGLASLAGLAAALRLQAAPLKGLAMALVLVGGALILWAFASGVLSQLLTDIGRLGADPARMGVLEARPLFLYSGQWNWAQPWVFFRGAFFTGLAALALFTIRVALERRAVDLLVWVTAAAMFVATYGQNRFGYYLMPMCALLSGWLATLVLDWRREAGMLAVALALFAPNIVPSALLESRPGSLPEYWRSAMVWLRENTAPPFTDVAGGDEYYVARYGPTVPPPEYTVMNWWDHGYWIVQIARRVPVANPTQQRAPNAARFYAATSEAEALARVSEEGSRYVISDWELPFRFTPERAIMGRFQNVVDWAGARHDDYYQVMYRRVSEAWVPVWVFHEPYYRSMAFRLSVLGGQAATPAPDAASVIVVGDRIDSTGMRFKEILSERQFPTHDAAVAAAAALPRANERALVVGLDPWRSAFPVEQLTRFDEVHAARTMGQAPSESPWVRVFRVIR